MVTGRADKGTQGQTGYRRVTGRADKGTHMVTGRLATVGVRGKRGGQEGLCAGQGMCTRECGGHAEAHRHCGCFAQ